MQPEQDLAAVEGGGLHEAAGRVRIADDRGQGLVDLVGQRGGELPQGRHAQSVGQLLSLVLELVFGPPASRDIEVRDDQAAFGTLERLHRHREPPRSRRRMTRIFEQGPLRPALEHALQRFQRESDFRGR